MVLFDPSRGNIFIVASLTVLLERIDADSKCRPELAARLHEMQPAAAGERACRRSHWLQRDVVLALWREDLSVPVTFEELDGDSAAGPSERQRRAPAEEGEAIVEIAFAELPVESVEGFFLAGGDPARVEHQTPHCRQFQPPLCARNFRQSEIRMEAKAHWDWAIGTRQQCRLQRQPIRAKRCGNLKPVREGEDCKEVAAGPIEPGKKTASRSPATIV